MAGKLAGNPGMQDALGSTLDLLSNDAHNLVGGPAASSHSATKDAAAEELLRHHQRELWRAADAHFVAEKLKQLKEHGLLVSSGTDNTGLESSCKLRGLASRSTML